MKPWSPGLLRGLSQPDLFAELARLGHVVGLRERGRGRGGR